MKGKVYLVGAGPGDPDLLTVKALRVLKAADAVLHDDLVRPEILGLVSKNAQIQNVGKRCGTKKITQSEINFLMVTLAHAGLQVVRLKSGDPLIFGRAGEEMEALRRAAVDFEVVPGVTSGFAAAAAAGISLTHRAHSSALVLLTGHAADGRAETDWRPLVSSGATLVIYMPHDRSRIAARLRNAGMKGKTPCAIISRASSPEQRIEITTVADLPHSTSLPAPTLLVVGDVVGTPLRYASAETSLSWLVMKRTVPEIPGLDAVLAGARQFLDQEELRA